MVGKDKKLKTPTLRMWRVFTTAVEQGSFLRTADVFQTDVAFVSREIGELENCLGEPLLQRSTRGVKPTWAGVQRYKEAIAVIQAFDRVLQSTSKKGVGTELRLAVPASLAELFVQWTARFGSLPASQGLTVMVEQYADTMPVDMIGYDLFVCEDVLPNARVLATALGFVQRGIAVAPDFLKTQSAVRVPEDLQKRPIIAERSGRTLMLGKDESVAIWVEPTMRVNNAGALAAAALAGAGYAVGVPLWQISSLLKTGRLTLVLEDWRIAARPVWLLKHPHTEHNTHIRCLEQYLIECWAQTEGLDAARRTFARRSLTDAH